MQVGNLMDRECMDEAQSACEAAVSMWACEEEREITMGSMRDSHVYIDLLLYSEC